MSGFYRSAFSRVSRPPAATGPLPEGLNVDGRHVWEPPILDYSELIDEEYEQKRKAYLKYTGGDSAKTTQFLDTSIELDLLHMYGDWVYFHCSSNDEGCDPPPAAFYRALSNEIYIDHADVAKEWSPSVAEKRNEDGSYEIIEDIIPWKAYEAGNGEHFPMANPYAPHSKESVASTSSTTSDEMMAAPFEFSEEITVAKLEIRDSNKSSPLSVHSSYSDDDTALESNTTINVHTQHPDNDHLVGAEIADRAEEVEPITPPNNLLSLWW